LSLVNDRDCPRIPAELGIQQLHIAIEDNPYEDVLMCLEGLDGWITDTLTSNSENNVVLVHCLQGRSRSAAVIIAYLMRRLELDYDAALVLAKRYRSAIGPNPGFRDQLRVWQELKYSIFTGVRNKDGALETKAEYEAWKESRGLLLSRSQVERSKALMKQVTDLAAKYSKGESRREA
jgi:hypothetical protein